MAAASPSVVASSVMVTSAPDSGGPTDYIINELLCVLKNNFSKIPGVNLCSVFIEFYSEDEITRAKKILCDFADKNSVKCDELKKRKSRVGDGKSRRDIDDILTIYTVFDARKEKLPVFYAADSSRMPSFKDVEFCQLLSTVREAKDNLTVKIDGLNSSVSSQIAQFNSSITALVADKINQLSDLFNTQVSEICKTLNNENLKQHNSMVTNISTKLSDLCGVTVSEVKTVGESVDSHAFDVKCVLAEQLDNTKGIQKCLTESAVRQSQITWRPWIGFCALQTVGTGQRGSVDNHSQR